MRWSVLVPVHLGSGDLFREVLERVLRAYDAIESRDFELVLCCDGPDPRVAELLRTLSPRVPVTLLTQERRGQSAASNRAARAARGELLLFAAQDVVPHPRLLAEHARAQQEHPGQMILGSLPYPAELEVTPFMDFLVNGGPQFAFSSFRNGTPIPPYCLYAPNFSVRADVFRALGGFREDIPYACQDSELGLRFAEQGGRIYFRAEAVGYHWHPQTLDGYLPRQYLAGRNTVTLLELHPTHRKLDWLREKVLEYYLPVAPRIPTYRKLVERFEADGRTWRVSVARSPLGPYEQDALWFLYDRITKCEFYRGVHDAFEERHPGWLRECFADWRLPEPEPLPHFRPPPARASRLRPAPLETMEVR